MYGHWVLDCVGSCSDPKQINYLLDIVLPAGMHTQLLSIQLRKYYQGLMNDKNSANKAFRKKIKEE